MTDPSETDPWSVSETALYREMHERLRDDQTAVVATIIDVEGSAYRRPGAKMLITPDNEGLGAVTAGCLEGPVMEMAARVREEGRPRVETFDLTDGDEWGLGLGCNGVIDVLLEPLDDSFAPAFEAFEDRTAATTLTAIDATTPSSSLGDRTVVGPGGERLKVEGRPELPPTVVEQTLEGTTDVRAAGKSATLEISTAEGEVRVFVDTLEPAPRLLLFGNQNDVQPVSRLGREAGFEVVVATPRGGSTSADFPHAHDVVVSHPTDLADRTDESTYAVLMSHNLVDDRLAVETLLTESPVPYVGLMGPRERFDRMVDDLADDGTDLSQGDFDRISTPVGLDLGGGEPSQIALSIVTEVLAVHNGRDGGRLKHKEGPIHERVAAASSDS